MGWEYVMKYIKPITIELMKGIPYIGCLVAAADKVVDIKDEEKQNERILSLEEQRGELLEASGVTLHLNNDIQKNSIHKLTCELNLEFKEDINSECREIIIDDVVVSERMIHINFIDSVERDYLFEDMEFLIGELLQYIEEVYIEVKKLEFY